MGERVVPGRGPRSGEETHLYAGSHRRDCWNMRASSMSDNQPTRTDADTAPWTSTPPASLGLCRRQRCYSLGRGSSRCWRLQLAPSPGRMSQRRLACIIHRLFLLLMTYLLAQFPAVFSGRLVSGGQGRGSRPSPARISRRICVVITSSSRGMHVSDTRRKTRIRSVLRSTYSILRCISGGLGGLSGGSWSHDKLSENGQSITLLQAST